MEEDLKSLMPDFLSFTPTVSLTVEYGGVDAKEGNVFKCDDVQEQPKVSYPIAEGDYYTLAMVDPDVTRKLSRHWLVGNIPGINVSEGTVLTPHKPPSPPFGGGYHRYFFFLYKQPGVQQHEPLDNDKGRAFFNLNEWAMKHQLELVGFTYFQTQRTAKDEKKKNKNK